MQKLSLEKNKTCYDKIKLAMINLIYRFPPSYRCSVPRCVTWALSLRLNTLGYSAESLIADMNRDSSGPMFDVVLKRSKKRRSLSS